MTHSRGRYIVLFLWSLCTGLGIKSAPVFGQAVGHQGIKPLIADTGSVLAYRTRISGPGWDATALMYFRRTDSAGYSVVAINELGMTIFRVKTSHGTATADYVPEYLRQQWIMDVFCRIPLLITHPDHQTATCRPRKLRKQVCFKFDDHCFYYRINKDQQVFKAMTGRGMGKTKAKFTYNANGLPVTIRVRQPWKLMKWKLNILEQS